jgi:hypothetical protein
MSLAPCCMAAVADFVLATLKRVAVEHDCNFRKKTAPMTNGNGNPFFYKLLYCLHHARNFRATVMSRTPGSKLEMNHLSLSTRFSAPYTTSKDLNPSMAGKR